MDTTENIETQARRMWTTRPVRLPRSQSPKSWFFGVCEGIAVRYQVSPVLVRLVVGLSVTLGGLGMWFYLVALLVMPRYGVPRSPVEVLLKNDRDQRFAPDREVGVRTLVVGVVLLVLGGIGSGGVTLGGVFGGVVVTAVVWWLLHQRLPVPPAGLTTPREDAAPAGPVPAYRGADLGSLTPAEGFSVPRTPPPSWDPLGAAPFAWDLPEPPGPAAGEATAQGAAGNSRGSAWDRFWRVIGRAVLGVVLAVVLAVVAMVGMVTFGVGPGFSDNGSGDSATRNSRSFTGAPVIVDSLAQDRTVETRFSDVDIDLRDLRLPDDRDVATLTVDARFSGVALVLPEKTTGPAFRVRVDCAQVRASQVDCDSADGILVPSTDTSSQRSGARAAAPEKTLALELRSTVSEIRMQSRPTY